MLAKMLSAITRAQMGFVDVANQRKAFEGMLVDILDITQSEYGFIGEVRHHLDGQPYLRTHAITNIAWDEATRDFYEKNAPQGLQFNNLKTLFGVAMLSGEVVIANSPATDSRAGGIPAGHPPLNSFMAIPCIYAGKMVALVGVANRVQGYDQQLSEQLTPLITTVGQLLMGLWARHEQEQQQAQLLRREAALRALNEIASLPSESIQLQLQQALKLAAAYLDLPFGIISQIQNQEYRILSQVCPADELQDGMVFELGSTYCSLTLQSDDVLQITQMGQSQYAGHPCYKSFALETYIGCPVWVDGERFGTVNFSSSIARAQPFDRSDEDFVMLLGRWIGAALQRQKREMALEKTSSLFQDLFAHISQGFVMQTGEGQLVQANPAACQILGLTMDQLLGRTTFDPRWHAIHEDGSPYPGETHPAMVAIRTGQVIRDDVMGIYNPQDDAYRWINVDAYPRINAEDPSKNLVYTVFTDITERKQTQEALKYEQELLSDIIKTQPAGVFRMRVSQIDTWQQGDWLSEDRAPFRFELINQAFCSILNLSRDELMDSPGRILCRLHPDDRPIFAEKNEAANFNFTLLIWEGRLLIDQQEKWVRFEAKPSKLQTGELCWTGLLIDINERKQVELAMQRLSLVASQTSNGVIITDQNGRIEWVNEGMERLSGYTLNELVGLKPSEVLQGAQSDPSVIAQMSRCIKNRRSFDVELINYHRNGQPYWVSIQCNPFFDSLGHLQGYIAVESDMTLRKLSELELTEARQTAEAASKAKSMFVANMSHEIRTPLNGVLGMAQLLLDTPLNDTQRKYIETIQTSGDALLSVINDILDFSKIEAGKLDLSPIEFDLHSMLDDFADMMAIKPQQKGVEFFCRIDANVPHWVYGDPGRIRQILINLSGNAIKFTDQGEVDVQVSLVAQQDELIELKFTIRDTGIGIEQAQLDRLFQSFSQVDAGITRRFGGTGLGLAISKQLVGLMRGQIGVFSEPHFGSEFWFTVQLGRVKHPAATPAPYPDLAGKRVLVAEKLRNGGEHIADLLMRKQMIPVVVTNAAEFMQALQDSNDFAIALIDFQLPGGEGEGLVRAIRADARWRELPLIMLTAVGQRGDANRVQAAGCNGFLSKPLHQRDLYEMLQIVLRDGQSTQLVTRHTVREARHYQMKILLAEDNQVNQLVAVKMLEGLGCRVDTANHGEAAIARLQEDDYDLVFMDMQMPVMDGLSATAIIRRDERFAAIPIIALTANAMSEDRQACLEVGMNDFLSKPLNNRALEEMLNRWRHGVLPNDYSI
ncbi:response regulator [Chitinibacter sp. SCUT-21]|uniref:response regulator n=1 Tax=Chitinibacter sp. SCUT-21 TaxID=2970891 RepID=UPI0035A5B7C6